MTTRRQFVASSVALIGATSPRTGTAIAEQQQQPGKLPAPIAALTSMRDRMVPITVEERKARIAKARRLLAENDFGAFMLTGGTSLRYFTNINWWLSERLLTVVIPREGRPFVVCPAFERDRAQEQINDGPFEGDADIMTWEEHENPWALLAGGLRDRGAATARIGIEETTYWVYSDGLAKELPTATLTSGTPITAGCRMVKSPAEIALMRLASQVTLKAYKAAWQCLREGMTQGDFAELVRLAHERLGFSGDAGVQVGPASALPHGSAKPQVVREGTILLMDGGCSVGGYSSDLSRTFVLGKASDRMKQVFEIEHRAQTTALKTARPGLPCEAVDAAARAVIVDAGFGPGYKYFTHRVGHGMGMDGHEWPYLVKGNTLPLSPGMVFSDEPGIYIPGEFGVRLEDDMLITESGAELFTPQSQSLEQPFE
ncbi:MAG TPA: Xaa-Pro peptidase family protein [Gemmatimonadales bacterium]|nr:Xaa-Pro peptidase family protein [Gemmatimonadales bacterium]